MPLIQSAPIAVAPMIDWTDRHCRYFFRLFSKHVVLYTEMVTASAILRGPQEKLLQYHSAEHPLVLQLGGSDPEALTAAARVGLEYGYDEINLNVGCPSDRVQQGRFGACLMAEPGLVAACVRAMQDAISIPVTVKTRLGIDDRDSYEELADFIQTVAASGCQHFILHARKAWLNGLSPKENRTIPPLNYDRVYQIKKDFPALTITINGGIQSVAEIETHLNYVDGVMLGRQVYQDPFLLNEIETHFYKGEPVERRQILLAMLPYIEEEMKLGTPMMSMARHLLNLFHHQPRAREWRRYLSEHLAKKTLTPEMLKKSLDIISFLA